MQNTFLNSTLKFYEKNVLLSDFVEIKNPKKDDENYTILGKGNFAYTEKMKFKYLNEGENIFAVKKLDISRIEENKNK